MMAIFSLQISPTVLGAAITLVAVLIGILASVIGWVVIKSIRNRTEIESLKLSYKGDESEQGHLQRTRGELETVHSRLDDLEDTISYFERKRERSQEEICEKIDGIITVLDENDINGHLPSDD